MDNKNEVCDMLFDADNMSYFIDVLSPINYWIFCTNIVRCNNIHSIHTYNIHFIKKKKMFVIDTCS